MSFPNVKVAFDGLSYTVTLIRDGKEVIESFGEHNLTVCAAREDELASWERAMIKGTVADDGLIYYLCAQPEDVGRPSLIWLEDKTEAVTLRKTIREAEELYYENEGRQDQKCTFCGYMDSECGGDHGDEMRDIQREAHCRY
jgi:hypothetical protein